MKNEQIPRGIRNNNPYNIIRSSIRWKGKIPHVMNNDNRFEQFETMELGIEAGIRNIQTKLKRGLDTLNKLIPVYAPPFENDTAKYIKYIAGILNMSPDSKLSGLTREKRIAFYAAFIEMENGNKYDEELNPILVSVLERMKPV